MRATDPRLRAIDNGTVRIVVKICRDQRQFRIVNYTMKCPCAAFAATG